MFVQMHPTALGAIVLPKVTAEVGLRWPERCEEHKAVKDMPVQWTS